MSNEPEQDDEILDAILRSPTPSTDVEADDLAVVIPFPSRDEINRRRMRQKRPWAD